VNLADLMDELGAALDEIEGLRVYPYWEDNPQPPFAIVTWPDPINYDATMGRGSDTIELDIVVCVARSDPRASRNLMAQYLDGSGAASVKAALEAGTYTTCDFVVVTEARIADEMSAAGIEVLGAVFQVQITGNGA
jgi:hypothetical protein